MSNDDGSDCEDAYDGKEWNDLAFEE